MSDEEISQEKTTPENIDIPEDAVWYTPKEVGKLFGIDPRTVIRWEASGKLETYKIEVVRTLGNHRRYSRKDIDRMYQMLNTQIEARGANGN